MLDNKNVHALIQLIDDPDVVIYEHVKHELKNAGKDIIPFLENSWENQNFGIIYQFRIEQLIHEIQFEQCKIELQKWKQSVDKNLLQGSLIVAKYQYPNLSEIQIKDFFEKLRKDIWLEINSFQTAFEKIKIFNHIFYEMYKFDGDHKSYYQAENSFLNKVVERKKGNPLSLSIIYSIVAQMLDIPVFGVNLPNHFICCYMDNNGVNSILNESNKFGVLFYINTFSKGNIFYEKEISSFLNQINVYPERSHFEPCSNTIIIKRMLNNLLSAYKNEANNEKVEEIGQLYSILD